MPLNMLDKFREYFFTVLGLSYVLLESIIVLLVVFGMFVIAILMTICITPLAIIIGIYKLLETCYYKVKGRFLTDEL